MITGYEIIAYSITNGIRIYMCIFMVSLLFKVERPVRSDMWLSLICGAITALSFVLLLSQIGTLAFEVIVILFVLHRKYQCKLWKAAVITVCFEIAVALWDFLFSVALNFCFENSTLDEAISKYLIPVWVARCMLSVLIWCFAKQGDSADRAVHRGSMILAAAGVFFILVLAAQSHVALPDSEITIWAVFSCVLLVAVLFYRVYHQYEMEKEIAQLKTVQAELLEHDYRKLNLVYSTNAKLYHDFHNHLEALYYYISNEEMESALSYIKDLRNPIEKIMQNVWTGDEAIDYLISSKLSAAEHSGIETKVNIEFPQHTNIKSSDLTAILGNLLDNALEALANLSGDSLFLYLTIRRINDMLIIKVENSCAWKLTICDTEMETSKEETSLHGWGLKSAQATAEQYDGTLELTCEDGMFSVVVTLCFRAI